MAVPSAANPAFRAGAQDPLLCGGDDPTLDIPSSPTIVNAVKLPLGHFIDIAAAPLLPIITPHLIPFAGGSESPTPSQNS